MDEAWSKDEVVSSLWNAYKKTKEYKEGYIDGIPPSLPLVIKQEKIGLERIYKSFVDSLLQSHNVKDVLRKRTTSEWLEEWKFMHKTLFEFVLKDCGNFRTIEVRFGSPGDEDLHKIPLPAAVPSAISELAYCLHKEYLAKEYLSIEEKISILAKVHYQFIRIHPFADGNGRIARVLTDQLAIFFDLPASMAGYPRQDPKRRENYHKGITACVEDPSCSDLAVWIKGYVDKRLETIA